MQELLARRRASAGPCAAPAPGLRRRGPGGRRRPRPAQRRPVRARRRRRAPPEPPGRAASAGRPPEPPPPTARGQGRGPGDLAAPPRSPKISRSSGSALLRVVLAAPGGPCAACAVHASASSTTWSGWRSGSRCGGRLTSSRMPAVFLTVRRNASSGARAPSPAPGHHVRFRGSEILFEYYAGRGIQLQPLVNFKKANLMHGACVQQGAGCEPAALAAGQLLAEMNAHGLRRAAAASSPGSTTSASAAAGRRGSAAWPRPPAVQALGRASRAARPSRDYLPPPARRSARSRRSPPTGVVKVRGPRGGRHYLQYSFAPRLFIINAFLQSVIGLYDYAELTGDERARRLWRAAEPEARARGAARSTSATGRSTATAGRESDQRLPRAAARVPGQRMCSRLRTDVYCDTARASAPTRRPGRARPRRAASSPPRSAAHQRSASRVTKLSAVQVSDHPRRRRSASTGRHLPPRRRLVRLDAARAPASTRSAWRRRSCAPARACVAAPAARGASRPAKP